MSAYLLTGRTGDLISILPFLKAECDAGQKPTLIVSNQHTSLFDGISYVDVVPFDGGIHLLREAYEFAKARFPDVKSLQVIGRAEDVQEITYRPAGQEHAMCTSFVKEMLKLAGKMSLWDSVLPLVFDRRNPERETKLLFDTGVAGTRGRKKKLMLVSVKGNSSPFPYQELLLELLEGRFSEEYRILELPQAERIYDLLALCERAYCLVATDSAPLHIARAVPDLPVIALTNDQPIFWNGSPWIPQWAWCCRYSDFPRRAVQMLKAIETCRMPSDSRYIQIWNAYDGKSEPIRYTREFLPVFAGMCGRDSANVLQDQKRIPYLKDCLRMGLQRAKDGEMVVLTRPDTKFDESVTLKSPCFSYRMRSTVEGDMFSPIVDMLAATKEWWKEHLAEVPDMLYGSDFYWSDALRVMFQKYGASDVTGATYREPKA